MTSIKNEKVTIKLSSESELIEAAKALIEFAGSNRIIAFYGAMGAGKTTFIKAICRILGVQNGMSSPTFSIVNEYHSDKFDKVYHFDFYRLKAESEAVEIGIEEYFYSGSYCLIEWPEKILNLLPEPRVKVEILVSQNQHLISFSHE
ncbi:MAG TPA: tRNA (adenosine(37)-N6)-threonylcarbamoyltransferase complex ATPase subunit type 1 TsaE [Bacteroidia bacterium]|nr:tRNA (adenosine(37)-N6)-threonylcarbamoyltransferase complex ATPase subunit type 1 TsaE [Bacteroidia bacterium]HNS13610.1 tRNA (adenosine(37)-N6)-threonylcarbamoyltransferase complex ATPase subunit type 1 TsaE [Bacteroidia bacterium]